MYQVAWSSDSRLLVSASRDSIVKVWDAKTRKLAMDLPGHADEVLFPPIKLSSECVHGWFDSARRRCSLLTGLLTAAKLPREAKTAR